MQASKHSFTYPFTAIVGQEKIKKALILNAINPMIGGVLLRGDKGTGKTTAVRSLVDILPEIEVSDCIFGCSPDNPCDLCKSRKNPSLKKRRMKIVELPLSATEDRVVGSIDVERALKDGLKAFQPGILAEANNNILYIDEVNLLEDHLVDTLLDVAASGWNVVEREGISVKHPSRFILVGTMNPEEGELRPQLLDRFGMVVDVRALNDAELRAEVVKRVEEFAKSPAEFCLKFKEEQNNLKRRISLAREILKEVTVSEGIIRAVAELCSELEIETHRADIITIRAAKALAAYKGRKEVEVKDVKEVAELTLPHRMRTKPFEEPKFDFDKIDSMLNVKTDAGEEGDGDKGNGGGEENFNFNDSGQEQNGKRGFKNVERKHKVGKANLPEIEFSDRRKALKGRRVRSVSGSSGKYVDFRTMGRDIAIDATLRAAAIRGANKPSRQDIRYKAYAGKVASSIALVVDASGSMASLKRMETAKGVLLKLLQDAYVRKDRISLIIFKDKKAEVIVPPTTSPQYALKRLADMTTGGKTPLSAGLLKGFEVLKYETRKNRIPILVLITDGRANVSIRGNVKEEVLKISEKMAKEGILTVVFDADDYVSLGFTKEIYKATNGLYYRLEDLDAERISDVLGHMATNITFFHTKLSQMK